MHNTNLFFIYIPFATKHIPKNIVPSAAGLMSYSHHDSLQILSTRARKGVILSDIKVAVCTFAFDILYVNGQPLLQEQLKVRREVDIYN